MYARPADKRKAQEDPIPRPLRTHAPASSGASSVHGRAVAWSNGLSAPRAPFRQTKLPMGKLTLAVVNPASNKATLTSILDYPDRVGPSMSDNTDPEPTNAISFVGFDFTITSLKGAGGSGEYNHAVHHTYALANNAAVQRMPAPNQLPALEVTVHDLTPSTLHTTTYNRNYVFVPTITNLTDDAIDDVIRNRLSPDVDGIILHAEQGLLTVVEGGQQGILQFHVDGRHDTFSRLLLRHMGAPLAAHARAMAVIGCHFERSPAMVAQIDATHEAVVLPMDKDSPIMPMLLKQLAMLGIADICSTPATTFPNPLTLVATILVPRSTVLTKGCPSCGTTVPEDNAGTDQDPGDELAANTICANPGCMAAAAGVPTVGIYVMMDALTTGLGVHYDGLFAAMPFEMALQHFHQLPPYAEDPANPDSNPAMHHTVHANVDVRFGIITRCETAHAPA